MSESLLDKLKNKPIPKKIDQLEIKIQPKKNVDIEIKTKIIDKRKENKIDRAQFLSTIKKQVTSTIPTKESIDNTDRETKIQSDKSKISTKSTKIKNKLKLVAREDSIEKPEKRKTPKPDYTIISEGPKTMIKIGDTLVSDRISKKEANILKSSTYYMNNRQIFVSFINSLFNDYKKELENVENEDSCEKKGSSTFSLLTHQKIVRDYLNLYTPYRGLLLYHGLGSGKTCSSIAIAEGMKSEKQVLVLTPASLRINYIEELKKCGDDIYKKNQFWEFIPINEGDTEQISLLSSVLNLSVDYIKKNSGAWLINIKKSSNYKSLNSMQQKAIDDQLNQMIRHKYKFINYNGLRKTHLKDLTFNYTINPFDNKVIIIDEAHNFVSRIVNKLKLKNTESLSMRLYEYLLTAENVKIVLLSGTPIINYPNELAIMYNILRGYIKTWNIPLNIRTSRKINKNELSKIFQNINILDYIDYKPATKMLTITRNPFAFYNVYDKGKYMGVNNIKNKKDTISNKDFETIISITLSKHEIDVVSRGITIQTFKALPDNLDDFEKQFINMTNFSLKNENLFKKRILGLTSYLNDKENLMPKYNEIEDFNVVKIDMSDFQFGEYEKARIQERKTEKPKKTKGKQKEGDLFNDTMSNYRIFSRSFCNFVFPEGKRPMPKDGASIADAIKNISEDALDGVTIEERIDNPDGIYTLEDTEILEKEKKDDEDNDYNKRILNALIFLEKNKSKYLTPEALKTYSPKFLHILDNLKDSEMRGLHLIYSQFRTLEGIGILKLVLENNGFTEFKIKKNENDQWVLNIDLENRGKPCFALYTGTESVEEKEIIRNIYNSDWDFVPDTIVSDLRIISSNNYYGEIIKTLMITASGAEGISLKNTRFVHIIEPYWHPVRTDQVIGRARRICSHQDLPEAMRTIKVFMYLMAFTKKQLDDESSIELKLKDRSKRDNLTVLTSDEALYEIASMKKKINKQLLKLMQEASIDCAVNVKANQKDNIQCFSFGKSYATSFSYQPSIAKEESDKTTQINKKTLAWTAEEVEIGNEGKFALNKRTGDVYDLESYNNYAETGIDPILVGKLIAEGSKYKFVRA